MPTHDIVDNRNEKLLDHIRGNLDSSQAAHFAVGYFFLSGFESIADRLDRLSELRLLIGNTSDHKTIEQMVEGYKRLDLAEEEMEAQAYPKKSEVARIAAEAAEHVRVTVERMDQTEDAETLVKALVRMIEEKRLKVRVYTRGRLHAKAYIFDYGSIYDAKGTLLERTEKGIAVVGSSNLSLAGIAHNTELNVVVHGNDNHAELTRWFDGLWDESQDFDAALMQEMQRSWAGEQVRPYDIYMKTLYALVRDRLETDDEVGLLWDDDITDRLADFQKVAVRQAVQIIRDYNGAFVADVVGLGKSYIGAAIIKHFERTERARPLVVCPAPLVDMWERYNEVYQLNARVLSTGYLTEGEGVDINFLLSDVKYRDRDFVLVDESHNFRNNDTQRYRMLHDYLAVSGKRVCFLTATPRNKSAWDIYHQVKLFHQDDVTDLPVDPPNLREYFKMVDQGKRGLPDLLSNILIRRTRNHILRWYGFDAQTHEPVDPTGFRSYLDGRKQAYVEVGGKHQFFPRRELETIEYSIEDTYQGLYQELRGYLGKSEKTVARKDGKPRSGQLCYARYGLWNYVRPEVQRQEPYATLQRAGLNLRGLIRVMLFKRFESSVYAFAQTVRRLLRVHETFLVALDQGIVPAGERAQSILYESDMEEQSDLTDLMDALRSVAKSYDVKGFDVPRLKRDIGHDVALLKKILDLVQPITPDQDAKLKTLRARLEQPPLRDGKRLIFTQYADTARYLHEALNPGGGRDDVEVIYSSNKDKARIVARFAPKANDEFQNPGPDINTLIATDVLSEGLNLQDCDAIINYDLHWNPVRLIQRFGRIDRIGSDHMRIYAFNFLPETGIEKNLGLKQKLHNRIQEIHDTIGEDAAILDRSEQLNDTAFYAIYERQPTQLSLFEDDEDDILDLSEAEEIMRQIKKERPDEYERIANLRDGIRTATPSAQRLTYVFCQAGRYQQLFLVDANGEIVSRDVPRVLGAVKCGTDAPMVTLPDGHNAAVIRVKRHFVEEVTHRQAERKHTLSLSHGQRYALRELRALFGNTDDDDKRAQINILEPAFRGPITSAVKRELNHARKHGLTGDALFKNLTVMYHQHNMRDWLDARARNGEDETVRVICSEALV